MTDTSFNYQKEGAARDLVMLLMKEYQWPMEKAIDTLYGSETYAKICNPQTGLYFQSSLYLYALLKKEISSGSLN